jgi:adenylosuccinate lyase
MQVFPERMRENLDANLGAFAVQKLEMLLKKKGMSAEEVYRILQAACFTATERRWHLENIVLNSAHECARPILELIDGGALSIKEVQAVFDVEEWIKEEPHLYERAGIAA